MHLQASIYELEHIAYNYVFIAPPKTPQMACAESAIRAAKRVRNEAATKSMRQAQEYLGVMRKLDPHDCDFERILRPEMLDMLELPPRKVYDTQLHGRRWQNKTWPEILEFVYGALDTEEWRNRHQIQRLLSVNTKTVRDWLLLLREEPSIEWRTIRTTGNNQQPQYRRKV